jgi:hypothetical protein
MAATQRKGIPSSLGYHVVKYVFSLFTPTTVSELKYISFIMMETSARDDHRSHRQSRDTRCPNMYPWNNRILAIDKTQKLNLS